ncbi:MAG TPA: hypothetical protein PKE54_16455, partial [Candidatus Obscuribacter sp.]|nr:hypothetical protein [Candidatus Obscuribacter sp.]
MQSAKPTPSAHPNSIDRNKAIVWSRYLIDSSDWLLFATKVTYLHADRAYQGLEQPKLVSLAVLTPEGKVVFEALLRAEEMVHNQVIAQHGLEQSVVFNARPFSEIAMQLTRLLE